MPLIEAPSMNRIVMRNHFLRDAVEMVLERRIVLPQKAATTSTEHRGSRDSTPIVGSCYFCRDQNCKQRKTRKSCVACMQPVCNEHSISKTVCIVCENH